MFENLKGFCKTGLNLENLKICKLTKILQYSEKLKMIIFKFRKKCIKLLVYK